jgi:hypothetical protein
MNYHQEVTSRHVLQALLKDRDGIVDYILAQAKIEPGLIEAKAGSTGEEPAVGPGAGRQSCAGIRRWCG